MAPAATAQSRIRSALISESFPREVWKMIDEDLICSVVKKRREKIKWYTTTSLFLDRLYFPRSLHFAKRLYKRAHHRNVWIKFLRVQNICMWCVCVCNSSRFPFFIFFFSLDSNGFMRKEIGADRTWKIQRPSFFLSFSLSLFFLSASSWFFKWKKTDPGKNNQTSQANFYISI